MKIGVKFGPDNWEYVISQVNPSCAEIWFRLDWKEKYTDIFDQLHKRNIPFGIHYWAVLENSIEPNLVYEPAGIAEKTEGTMRETIDIASSVGASYVNIHPGSYSLRELNLDEKYMRTHLEKTVSVELGNVSLEKRATRLSEYASSKHVLFLLETLPKNELLHWEDATGRESVQKGDSIRPETLVELGKKGIFITNDFGHTLASWDDIESNLLYEKLLTVTKELLPYTKLIHLNTVCPPFNGTDSHNGVLEEDFLQGVLPNREQVSNLLRLFKEKDIWIIPEPDAGKMVENYREILKIVGTL
jgi:endonuclease IV